MAFPFLNCVCVSYIERSPVLSYFNVSAIPVSIVSKDSN